jgi:hypothetical protein
VDDALRIVRSSRCSEALVTDELAVTRGSRSTEQQVDEESVVTAEGVAGVAASLIQACAPETRDIHQHN